MVVTLADEHDISGANPNFLAHLPPDVSQPRHPVVAIALGSPIPQHADHLSIGRKEGRKEEGRRPQQFTTVTVKAASCGRPAAYIGLGTIVVTYSSSSRATNDSNNKGG